MATARLCTLILFTNLEGLLERDPAKRLADPAQIKRHPYFASIDWDRLLRKEIQPTYIPQVSGPSDISMIDDLFTKEDFQYSVDDTNALSETAQKNFDGFTFVADSALKKK